MYADLTCRIVRQGARNATDQSSRRSGSARTNPSVFQVGSAGLRERVYFVLELVVGIDLTVDTTSRLDPCHSVPPEYADGFGTKTVTLNSAMRR